MLPRLPPPRSLHSQCVTEWKISDWFHTSPASLKRNSQDFECGGHNWHILLFPLGLVKGEGSKKIKPTVMNSVAMYLTHSDQCVHSSPWKVEADILLAICNTETSTTFLKRSYHHQFTPASPFAGTHEFRRLGELMRCPKDGGPPILVNGSADVVLYLRISEAFQKPKPVVCKTESTKVELDIPMQETPCSPQFKPSDDANDANESQANEPISACPPQALRSPTPSRSSMHLATKRSSSPSSPSPEIGDDSMREDAFTTSMDVETVETPPTPLCESMSEHQESLLRNGTEGDVQMSDVGQFEPAYEGENPSTFEEPVDISSPVGDDSRRRHSISSSSVDEEAALESELNLADEDTEPSSLSLLEVEVDENASMSIQEPPPGKKRYQDAMDIVLSKVKNDKKRSEQKIRYLSELVQTKDEEMKLLKERLDTLEKEKENAMSRLSVKNSECKVLYEDMKEVTLRKDEMKNLIAMFSSDLERTLAS